MVKPWLGMEVKYLKQLKIAENGKKWLKTAENCWKLLEIIGYGWK